MVTINNQIRAVLDRILLLKENKGLSDKALEEDLKIPYKKINDWKRNNSKSFLECLPQIAKYFDVSTDYLLGVTSERNNYVDNDIVLEDSNKKEVLTEDKAVSMIQKALVDGNIVNPGESLTDDQLLVLTEFINNNASMLKKLMNTGK